MVGVPVIINHKDLNSDNVDDERVGVVNSVWFDEKDGWYWCDGIIWNETAQNLITDKNWSVSCSYDVKTADNKGGSENNIKYDMEFLDGVFTHLALVNNPRYERANIVFNSKTVIENTDKEFVTVGEGKEQHSIPIDYLKQINMPKNINVDDLNIVEFTKDDIDNFKDHGSVSKFYNAFIKGREITHSDERLGKIYFDEDGLGESKHINRPKNFFLIGKAIELVETSKYDRWEYPDKHERNDNIAKFHIVYTKAKMPNATKVLQIKIAELENGKKYYFLRPILTINNSPISAIAKDVKNDNSSLPINEANIIITDFSDDFNPNVADNSKETDMALIEELKKLITKVENEKGDDMEDKEKVENEKVDKRDIIRQIMAIAGKHEDNEDVKTIAKLAEKLGYDESEAGSADNKKAKNEKEDEDEAKNCKVKNEDAEDKDKVAELKEDEKEDAENCKVKNSKDDFYDKMNEIYNSSKEVEQPVEYVSRESKIQAANDYFAK